MSIQPPTIPGISWDPRGSGKHEYFVSKSVSDHYWKLHRFNSRRLFTYGLKTEKAGEVWQVVFTPRFSSPNVQLVVDDLAAEVAEFDVLRQQRDAEMEAERHRRRHEIAAQRRAEAAKADEIRDGAVAEAREIERVWGEFAVRKQRLRELLEHHDDPDTDDLSLNMVRELLELCASTRQKHVGMLATAKNQERPGVDWPDADVEAALRLLTGRDGDRASIENDLGWSKADSPSGHWAYAMLDIDRELAIKVGRWIVGKYARTQLGREAA